MVHETAGSGVVSLMVVVKTLILLVGSLVTYYAYKAYRRTGDRSLGLLTAGFASITFGAFLGGTLYELLGTPLALGVAIEGVFVLVGLALVAASLRT
ncbi:DUF7521 family protein [Natronorarus salvus]|uniref:DUF7521 family protein n=1 Tax=Natronorarus salvus TaxID=3117733 RepID=UPI002F25F193